MGTYSLSFSLSNLGPKSYCKLINKFGNPKAAWEGSRRDYEKVEVSGQKFEKFDIFRQKFDHEAYARRLKKQGVKYVSYFDKKYPAKLKKLVSPPIGIFCKGNTDLLQYPLSLAVVGTRKMTRYGKEVTELLVLEFVKSGVCIVSGLALGVDGISHRVAIENHGKTIAILACGVDCCAPSENYNLYSDILKNDGLIVSEYPLSSPPQKGTFLARNRLIAALSDGVLVTEAAFDSGSLVTADWGLRLGKKVFAIPGPITSRMSEGTLGLLKNGAMLVTGAGDILEELRIKNDVLKDLKKESLKSLSKDELKVISLLESEEMTIDQISKKIKLPVGELMIILSILELKNVLKNTGGKISLLTSG